MYPDEPKISKKKQNQSTCGKTNPSSKYYHSYAEFSDQKSYLKRLFEPAIKILLQLQQDTFNNHLHSAINRFPKIAEFSIHLQKSFLFANLWNYLSLDCQICWKYEFVFRLFLCKFQGLTICLFLMVTCRVILLV